MNKPTKTNIKKIFSNTGIQLTPDSTEMIERELVTVVERKRCVDGNLKRLTPELFYVAMGRLNM